MLVATMSFDGWAGCKVFSGNPSATTTLDLRKLNGSMAQPSLIYVRPRVENDYPPNLSILISGGKETNRDSLSNGE